MTIATSLVVGALNHLMLFNWSFVSSHNHLHVFSWHLFKGSFKFYEVSISSCKSCCNFMTMSILRFGTKFLLWWVCSCGLPTKKIWSNLTSSFGNGSKEITLWFDLPSNPEGSFPATSSGIVVPKGSQVIWKQELYCLISLRKFFEYWDLPLCKESRGSGGTGCPPANFTTDATHLPSIEGFALQAQNSHLTNRH